MSPEARAWAGDGIPLPPRPTRTQGPEPPAAPEEQAAAEVDAPAAAGGTAGAGASETGEPAEPGAEDEPAEEPGASIVHGRAAAPHVAIVGGGGIGAALAHDLAQRGLRVTLVERGEVTSGATGRSLGLVHSGARFVLTDRTAAVECVAENRILRRIAPGSFEANDGLLVAVTDEDAEFAYRFLDACWHCAVPARRIDARDAIRMEPGLNPGLRLAVHVDDATMDAMRLPLRFLATARANGAQIMTFTEVGGLAMTGRTVSGLRVRDHAGGRDLEIGADLVVNAAGAWALGIAGFAGATLPVSLRSEAAVAVRGRLANMVVGRLHQPGEGDVVVPQRLQTIAGTIGSPTDDPEGSMAPDGSVEAILREAALLLPALAAAPVRAAWSAPRPVVEGAAADERRCFDHSADRTPVEGLITIVGGSATRMRATAEITADLVCRKLGVERPCETGRVQLLPYSDWYAR